MFKRRQRGRVSTLGIEVTLGWAKEGRGLGARGQGFELKGSR